MTNSSDARIDRTHDRREELLAGRVLAGLDDAETRELASGIDPADAAVEASLERTAARLAHATIGDGDSMPVDVAGRVRATLASSESDRVSSWRHSAGRFAAGFAAAAVLVIATLVLLRAQAVPSAPPTPTEARAALVSRATDLITMRWRGTDHPDVREARSLGLIGGDVVWSDREAEGFVRVCHLAVNDPSTGSYRVWIWNADGGPAVPLAGGDFDVTQAADFTVIRIGDSALVRSPVRASVTFVPIDAAVAVPSPGEELIVAQLVSERPAGAGQG